MIERDTAPAKPKSSRREAAAPAGAVSSAPQIIIPGKRKEAFFLPYQKAWIEDKSRIKLFEKSRQVGLSWSTAYGLVRKKSMRGARLDAWVSSRDDLQACLFKDDCAQFAGVLNIAAQDMGQQVLDPVGKASAYVLRLANGCNIYSLSSNPDAQAGKRGDRILDEFALHPDPRKLWSIAYPGITWGGNMEIISTHRGEQNLFNQLIQEARHGGNPKGISLHRVTLQDALDQGFLAKLKSKLPKDDPRMEMDEAAYFDFIRSGCIDEEAFMQEYMCVPADEQSAFISYELLDGCTMRTDEEWERPLSPICEYFLGVDVGRKHDLTCLYLLERVGDMLTTRRLVCMQGETYAAQQAAISELARLPWVRRVCIDATGIGNMLAENLQREHGAKVEPVMFTAGVKEDLALTLRRRMEERMLRLPKDPKLASDLRSIRKATTSAGNVRFVGERNADGHADRFWALALAIHAAKPAGEIHFAALGNTARPGSARRRITSLLNPVTDLLSCFRK